MTAIAATNSQINPFALYRGCEIPMKRSDSSEKTMDGNSCIRKTLFGLTNLFFAPFGTEAAASLCAIFLVESLFCG